MCKDNDPVWTVWKTNDILNASNEVVYSNQWGYLKIAHWIEKPLLSHSRINAQEIS
jgi:hypothetical protein